MCMCHVLTVGKRWRRLGLVDLVEGGGGQGGPAAAGRTHERGGGVEPVWRLMCWWGCCYCLLLTCRLHTTSHHITVTSRQSKGSQAFAYMVRHNAGVHVYTKYTHYTHFLHPIRFITHAPNPILQWKINILTRTQMQVIRHTMVTGTAMTYWKHCINLLQEWEQPLASW